MNYSVLEQHFSTVTPAEKKHFKNKPLSRGTPAYLYENQSRSTIQGGVSRIGTHCDCPQIADEGKNRYQAIGAIDLSEHVLQRNFLKSTLR